MRASFMRSTVLPAIGAALAVAYISIGGVEPAVAQHPMTQKTNLANDPGQLLQQYPKGGPGLISKIRELVVADPANLRLIPDLLAAATKNQKAAIGAGLAHAAQIVVQRNQAHALKIQQAVARARDQDLVVAYAAVAGDPPIGTIGGGIGSRADTVGARANSLGGSISLRTAAQAIE